MKNKKDFTILEMIIVPSIIVLICLLMLPIIQQKQEQINNNDYVYSYILNNVEKEIQSPNLCDIKNMTCTIGDTTFKVDSINVLKGDKKNECK